MEEGDSKMLSVGPQSDSAESRAASGKPHKSVRKSSRLPRDTASISTKYQNKAMRNAERKGFSVQARRFKFGEGQNGNPGPGAYMSHSPLDVSSPSFSKRGAGGLASQAARLLPPRQRLTPAPNAYNLPSSLLLKHCFSQVGTSAFQPPIAVATETPKNVTPAPNQYKVSYSGIERHTAVSAHSVFRSQTGRSNSYSNISDWPSPCEYSVTDALTRPSPRVPFSSFKSSSARILCLEKSQVPGPGTYSPHAPPAGPTRVLLPRGHYLCLSAPAVPPPKAAPLPGPGQYDIAPCDSPPKMPVPGAVFLSTRGRWVSPATGRGSPGPGYYDPVRPVKQSFLYNQCKRWIPA